MIEETVILHLLDDTTLNDLFCWVWSLQEMYANIHIALDRDTGYGSHIALDRDAAYGSQEHKQNLIEILDMAHKNILHLLEILHMAPKNMLHLIQILVMAHKNILHLIEILDMAHKNITLSYSEILI